MQRTQENEAGAEEARAPRQALVGEFWGAIEGALGATTTAALRRILEARGGVAGDDLASLERILGSMKELLGPRAGEILEEYAVRALHLVDRDLLEP